MGPVVRFFVFVSCLFCVCFVFVSCGVLHLVCGVVVGFVFDVLCVMCVGVGGVGVLLWVCLCVSRETLCVVVVVCGVCVVSGVCAVFMVWCVSGVWCV